MKRVQILPLVLLLVVVFSFIGCYQPEATRITKTPVSPTETPSAPVTAPETITPSVTTPPTKTPAQTTTTAPYGTITIVTGNFGSGSVDPIKPGSPWGACLYDMLITWDENGNYVGSVAESWELGQDGNTWTFHIHHGIKFHNGDPLTARDVKFTIDRIISPDSTNPWSGYLRRNLDVMEVPDDYTFIYKTVNPEPPLVSAFSGVPVLPEDYISQVGPEGFYDHPVGSGPWKFIEHVPEVSVLLEANTDHWKQVPAYKYVKEYYVAEEYTRGAALQSGEADIAYLLSPDRTAAMIQEGWRTQKFGLPFVVTLTFPGTWMTDGPTSDIRVRRALSYAINRQEICDTIWRGLGTPGGGYFTSEGSWGWDPNYQADPYDPDLARQLLEAAGYPAAFADPTIKMLITSRPEDFELALLSCWTAVGLDVELEVIDAMVWYGLFFVRQTDPGSLAIGSIIPFAYTSVFDAIYQNGNMYTSIGVHTAGNDPVADALYDKVITTLDDAARKQLWIEFQDYTRGMFVNIGIASFEAGLPVGPNLGEFTTNTLLGVDYSLAGVRHPR